MEGMWSCWARHEPVFGKHRRTALGSWTSTTCKWVQASCGWRKSYSAAAGIWRKLAGSTHQMSNLPNLGVSVLRIQTRKRLVKQLNWTKLVFWESLMGSQNWLLWDPRTLFYTCNSLHTHTHTHDTCMFKPLRNSPNKSPHFLNPDHQTQSQVTSWLDQRRACAGLEGSRWGSTMFRDWRSDFCWTKSSNHGTCCVICFFAGGCPVCVL